jgi:hypothetical protein
MGTLSIDSYTGTVKSAEEMLALWRQVEVDIAETGQSYRAGGVEITMAEIGMVEKRVAYWEKRVLAKRGAIGRNTADIEPGESEDRDTL